MRFGTIAIVGRSNVGKSTFLNSALGQRLSIVSPIPQTTRDSVLGIVRRSGADLAFLDTPGLHQPKSELGRRMNAAALEAARGADAIVFMTDVAGLVWGKRGSTASPIPSEDAEILGRMQKSVPTLLVINKVDLLGDKSKLLPLLTAYSALYDFRALLPVSVRSEAGTATVLDELEGLMPEGESGFDADALTDRPLRFFAAEYIREQVLLAMRGEVPHAVAVSLDEVEERPKSWLIRATLHVEKLGQRKILIGTEGRAIKAIRVASQARIGELVGCKVHLELFVRVTPRWKNTPRQLAELGYVATSDGRQDEPPKAQKRARPRSGGAA